MTATSPVTSAAKNSKSVTSSISVIYGAAKLTTGERAPYKSGVRDGSRAPERSVLESLRLMPGMHLVRKLSFVAANGL